MCIKVRKIIFMCLMVLMIITIPNKIANAESNRETLKEELNKQEQILEKEMQPINPIDKNIIENLHDKAVGDLKDSFQNSSGIPDFKSKSELLQKFIFKIIINSRSVAIYSYIGIWVIGILYAATFGSRDVNKRRKTYLIIRNSTLIFLTYINIPLFIIWLNADKSSLSSITIFNVVYDFLEFLQRNSLIIASLMAYAGITRVIISRNDLPLRRQGKYLIKFSIVTLILLNVAPVAMYFLI